MSGLFQDKEYEEMEWLSKAIEPFNSTLNDVAAKLPQTYSLSCDEMLAVAEGYYIDIETLILLAAKASSIAVSEVEAKHLSKLYSYHIEPDTYINLKEKVLSGGISISKPKDIFDDEELITIFSDTARDILLSKLNTNTKQLNELADLLDVPAVRKTRSSWKKKEGIVREIISIIQEDKWKIRSQTVIEKFVNWVVLYVNNNNLAALSSITRLKCMTYNGNPIYSIKDTI